MAESKVIKVLKSVIKRIQYNDVSWVKVGEFYRASISFSSLSVSNPKFVQVCSWYSIPTIAQRDGNGATLNILSLTEPTMGYADVEIFYE